MKWTNCKECLDFDECEHKENCDGCFSGTKEEDIEEDVLMKDTPYPIVMQLQLRGFQLHERYADYATGSISKYFKARVHCPRQMTSLLDEKKHNAYYIEIERHHEPGYIECDSHTIKQIYVREDKLVEFFIANEIFTREEFNQKMEERRRRLKCQ